MSLFLCAVVPVFVLFVRPARLLLVPRLFPLIPPAGVFRRRFVPLSFGVPLRVVPFLVILAFRLPGAGLVLVFRAIFGLSVLALI